MIIKVLAAAFLLLLLNFACNSAQQKEKFQRKSAKVIEHIPFQYDREIYSKVELRRVPKKTAEGDGQAFPDDAPEHTCFYLEDKRPLPAFEKGPRYFYPAYSFICLIPLSDSSVPNFDKAYPSVKQASTKLAKLLQERPSTFQSHKELDELPYNNAGQAIQSKVQYLDSQAGSGVLFLTQYTQEGLPTPVNNEELICGFQGLTKGHEYYIAARLAITHPSLPKGIDFTDHIERDQERLYLTQLEKKLEGFPDDSFRPSLTALRMLISSLSVN